MAAAGKTGRPITGWHVLAMFVAFFGVIIAVNITLAWQAISTFPGLEVKNSYVASQTFDAERAAQQALGWTLDHGYDPVAQELRLTFTDAQGVSVQLATLDVLVGRTTEAGDDIRPNFDGQAGVYVAPATLAQGRWMMAVEARALDGTLFRQRLEIAVAR